MVQYQTLGSVVLDFATDGADRTVGDYQRSLDLDTAIATTRFTQDGVTYTREVLSSAPDDVVVMRLSADRPGKLSFAAGRETPFPAAALSGQGGDFDGKPGAIRFKALARAIPEGGTLSTD